ncbi:MBL fold metallo-hydrolase [Marinicella sp. S1101]|uniref:MBL fold metallo-hydrolase n=1 Tax=Marinicella marina TaxID=2996016 RepID=UPI002260CF58|nr:MBL fold metallo-hydrolase [Marinicella marina]MCX7552996.1 MBL fold metallo-hydrolase [Marinicella marina]MDJ1139694.1 MBL fold metallo-hydrolase [Marinicella marina]
MSLKTVCFALFLVFHSCWVSGQAQDGVSLLVLGVAQDAGYPQLNCYKPHCQAGWDDANKRKFATSLALIDMQSKQKFLFEATPDIRQQMYQLHQQAPDGIFEFAGVFLTHGHMGHYTGLMHMGREAAGTQNVPVYVMPRFKNYLEMNGPWSQLVSLNNIKLMPLKNKQPVKISAQLSITPFTVPHRDEFTETVGYQIKGPNKTALFIPDIDKWQKWEEDIIEAIGKVDFALLDATFFANGEIPNRDMTEIPHPFVEESMALFKDLPTDEKNKITFIHFNHSNPLIDQASSAAGTVSKNGFRVAYRGMQLDL